MNDLAERLFVQLYSQQWEEFTTISEDFIEDPTGPYKQMKDGSFNTYSSSKAIDHKTYKLKPYPTRLMRHCREVANQCGQ